MNQIVRERAGVHMKQVKVNIHRNNMDLFLSLTFRRTALLKYQLYISLLPTGGEKNSTDTRTM